METRGLQATRYQKRRHLAALRVQPHRRLIAQQRFSTRESPHHRPPRPLQVRRARRRRLLPRGGHLVAQRVACCGPEGQRTLQSTHLGVAEPDGGVEREELQALLQVLPRLRELLLQNAQQTQVLQQRPRGSRVQTLLLSALHVKNRRDSVHGGLRRGSAWRC